MAGEHYAWGQHASILISMSMEKLEAMVQRTWCQQLNLVSHFVSPSWFLFCEISGKITKRSTFLSSEAPEKKRAEKNMSSSPPPTIRQGLPNRMGKGRAKTHRERLSLQNQPGKKEDWWRLGFKDDPGDMQ